MSEATIQEWAIRILILAAIFLVGVAEMAILKERGCACITWFFGIAAASFCIAFLPLPVPVGTIAGWCVFLCGVVALVIFCRK